jgi:formylglycine-generating enzyme required for sulfatase activity
MKSNAFIFVVALLVGLGLAGCGSEEVAEDVPVVVDDTPEKPYPGEMVMVPAGEFTMGTDKDPHQLKLAEPAHTVDLPAYEIDVYEVTNGEFAKFQIESDYRAEGDWRDYYSIGNEDFPVANVTWDDAGAYCEWAGKRLPTEEEWEKAARGTEGLLYPWGPQFDFTKSNVHEYGVRNTMEVGSMPEDKSPYGVYDMFGNVAEWTETRLAPYPGGEEVQPELFRTDYKIVRGSSYAMKGEGMFLFSRTAALPKAQYGYGFRCVRDVGGQAEEETE